MEQTPDLLQEYENEIHLVPAPVGLRFLNYLIDVVIFYVLMTGFGAVWGLSMVYGGSDASEITESVNSSPVFLYLVSFLTFLAYYTIFEGASKGKTLGKMITGTVVVKDNGAAITFKDALLRSLCRMIPFEPFSTFGGRPWHDTITHTMVIKKPR